MFTAIKAGMIHLKKPNRDYSWIIISCAMAGVLLAVTIPAFWVIHHADGSFKYEVRSENFVNGWSSIKDASWGKNSNVVGGIPMVLSLEKDGDRNNVRQESISLKSTTFSGTNLVVSNITTVSKKAYILDTVAVRKLFYIDRTYEFTNVSLYNGLNYIKTSNDDRYRNESNFLQFDVNNDVTVYVAYDDRISSKASWLSAFIDTGDNVLRNGTTFSLYARNYSLGHISLGGTSIPSGGAGGSYIVILKPLEGNKNISEIGSLNKYVSIILIFIGVISLLLLGKYINRKKFYKKEKKEENKLVTEDKTEGENKGSRKAIRYHIIAIASGKGGVGKTTIAANLGIMLSKLNNKVTIMDMDLAMPNLEIITGLKSTPVGLIDFLEGRLGLDRVTYAGPEGIKIIPPGVMLEGYSKEETKQKIIELLKNFSNSNDFIILDMPPGREAIDVLSSNDIGVLLVVNSNKPSILDAVNIKVLLDKKKVKTLGVILNRYERDPELIDEIEKTLDSKVVAVIPESKMMNDAYMYEECFAATKEGSIPYKELMDLAMEIINN
jgi:septum site-determining protein MinD